MSVLLLIFIQIIEFVYRVIKVATAPFMVLAAITIISTTGSRSRQTIYGNRIQLPGSVQKPEQYGDKKKFHVRLESRQRNFDKL